MPTNDEILEQGLRKAKQAIYKAVWRQMKSLSVELVRRAVEDYDGGNLTGNTITSISAGIYDIDSPFPLILNAVDVVGLKEPIWHKMSAPNIWQGEDYDGNERRRFRADIVTDEDFGTNTSIRFLLSYRLSPSYSLGIVVCTGTEYSEYLTKADALKYDVLISAAKAAPRMAEAHWRKIKID